MIAAMTAMTLALAATPAHAQGFLKKVGNALEKAATAVDKTVSDVLGVPDKESQAEIDQREEAARVATPAPETTATTATPATPAEAPAPATPTATPPAAETPQTGKQYVGKTVSRSGKELGLYEDWGFYDSASDCLIQVYTRIEGSRDINNIEVLACTMVSNDELKVVDQLEVNRGSKGRYYWWPIRKKSEKFGGVEHLVLVAGDKLVEIITIDTATKKFKINRSVGDWIIAHDMME